jgi:hypothetical protein
MKTVQKYISDDGREFLDSGKCIAYEALCKEVSEIMSTLPAIPDLPGCGFVNGDGYLQHDPALANAARIKLLKIANTIMPHTWFQASIESETAHASYAGRLIGEMNERCLYSAWHRFMCMTPEYREYGQPYFANNPHEAKDVRLNAMGAA